MSKKIKVMTMGDHPLSPSGVGNQTRYICEALLQSGDFEILSLGGALKHHNYNTITVDPYENDWKIIPVDGYGTPELVRSVVRNWKPDIIWIMTDPRFWDWLWMIENEIRSLCPIVYYHVWDNYPYPMFNRNYYLSNDHIVSISKLTDDVIRNVVPEVPCTYIPHAVDSSVFVSLSLEGRKKLRNDVVKESNRDKFIVFWNNRNARRKQSGTLIFWFKEWLDKRNLHDKAQLILHTDPKDPNGQDLVHITEHLGLTEEQILFSTARVPLDKMGAFYHMADVTVNISDAEGFGLATLESLSCGTPIIVTMTGGLQEQIMGDDGPFGVPLFPASKAIIGSQNVPYIYEDRLNKDHFISALSNMYDMGPDARYELGQKGRAHVLKNYNFKTFREKWVNLMREIHETEGSWSTRKKSKTITFEEIV